MPGCVPALLALKCDLRLGAEHHLTLSCKTSWAPGLAARNKSLLLQSRVPADPSGWGAEAAGVILPSPTSFKWRDQSLALVNNDLARSGSLGPQQCFILKTCC